MARARELVGDDVELAVDAWLNPNVEYAVRLGEMLRPYRIKWLEDFLPADDLDGYAAVRQRLPGLTLASGEHWYGIGTFASAVQRRLVDILQPDLQWCGGLSNAVRICHLADAAGLTVIAHAGMNTPFGQHLSFAMPSVQWGERSEGVSPPGCAAAGDGLRPRHPGDPRRLSHPQRRPRLRYRSHPGLARRPYPLTGCPGSITHPRPRHHLGRP